MSIGAIGRAIQGAVAVATPIAASARLDAYDLLRGGTQTPDDSGGYTESPSVVESGRCNLTAGAVRPEERAIADAAGSQSPYVARNMPPTSLVTAQDQMIIGGRTFEVLGIAKTEATRVVITAVLEERG